MPQEGHRLNATRAGGHYYPAALGNEAMLISPEDVATLESIRSDLAEVIRQLHAHRDDPGGDVAIAIKHLENAIAEIDRSIA